MAKKIVAKTICIVEDNTAISELMKVIVEGEGFKVKTFLESGKVESYAIKSKPALIIMDLWIPGQGGASLVKILKAKKETKDIPIILVSAKNSLAKIAKQCKADAYLPKPFNVKDLVGMVQKFA